MQRSVIAILGFCALMAGVTASAQQSTTTSEVRQFEVLAVDGNTVVVRGERGTQEITVPPEFRLTVDGRAVTVAELKPGMKGTARITTTTTETPVYVTEVRNGVVMQRNGNSIIVRNENGIRMFTESDVTKRGIRLMRDGKLIEFGSLTTGDRLSATIITEQPPRVMTQRDVEASLESAKTAPAAAAAVIPPSDTGRPPDAARPEAARPEPVTSAATSAADRGTAPDAGSATAQSSAADAVGGAAVSTGTAWPITSVVIGGVVLLVVLAFVLARRRRMVP